MAFTYLFTDARAAELDIERAVAGSAALLLDPRQDRFEAIEAGDWARADAVITARIPVTAAAIPLLSRARIVIRQGVGFDIVDLKACGEAGIAVCNVPDYGTTEVADSAVAMMLTFARGIAACNTALRTDLRGGWTHAHNVTARRLRGACFGVIGLGRIGTAAALRAQAFGMRIAFFDPHLPNGAELSFGFTRAPSLHAFLALADVISIHAPLTAATDAMIDEAAIAACRPGAYLINTARGPICDTAALCAGLKSGKLAAVALDVLPVEPAAARPDDPLLRAWQADEPWVRGRVVITPHAAWFSPPAMDDLRRKAMETACDYLTGGNLANCVNAEYLLKPR